MSALSDAFKNRRSIRKFQPHHVPREVLLEVLDAARWAPSAHNAQPWRFLVLTDPEQKHSLAEAMADAWRMDLEKDGASPKEGKTLTEAAIGRFTNAPVLVVACLTMEGMRQFPDEARQRVEHDLAVQSLGVAVQNLLLAAYARGLGACWYCAPAFCPQAVRQLLKIPCEVEPQALIALGYHDEPPKTRQRKPLEDLAYLNGWGTPF